MALKTYYHVTFVHKLKHILYHGIVPGKRRIWQSRYGKTLGERKAVYAYHTWEMAYRWAFKQAWEFRKQTVIIEFKEYEEEMIPQTVMLGYREYVKYGKIEPEQIVDVYAPIDKRVWKR